MNSIKTLLTNIKLKDNKQELITEFQDLVWEDRLMGITEEEKELLSDFAYDLDFYEPDKVKRSEDPSYFGDERLVQLIDEFLQKIT